MTLMAYHNVACTIHFLLLTDISLWANTWLVSGLWPGLDLLQIPTF